jgi:class 3 adenylate cyclase
VEPQEKENNEDRIDALVLKDVVVRTIWLTWILALIFGLYGPTSIAFIQRFSPEVTLWQNTWPRLLFTALPFLVLGLFLKNSKIRDGGKILCWIAGFSGILHVTAWIYIWPIALHKTPSILTYVNGANIYLFAVVYAVIAPPKRYLARFSLILIAVFVAPLLAVTFIAGDAVIFKLVFNDSALSLGISIFLSSVIDRLRRQIAVLKYEKEIEASKFLGPVLSKAIFDDEKRRLERIRCRGFVISIDIRDSTTMQQIHKEKWLDFRREYFSVASRLVQHHGGYIQKTVGDCHVINFGVMDYGVDLSDIPGIETELARADDLKLQRAGDAALKFVCELFAIFDNLSRERFSGSPVFLGAGMDKGWVERSVQGNSVHTLELDVNGDPVNCASRLQEYSKTLRMSSGEEASVLVMSPFATDYLKDTHSFQRAPTVENPIRNYPGIKWILVYRHSSKALAANLRLVA